MKKSALVIIALLALVLSALRYFNILNGIQIFCAVIVIIPLGAFILLRFVGKKAIKELNKGEPAIATIIKCDVENFTMSGGGGSKSFVLKMEVSVTNENSETWQTKMMEHVADFQAAQFQPGLKFKVVYQESNRNKIKAYRSVIDRNTIETVA